MTIPPMLNWVQSTNLSVAIREGGLPYPVIGGLHLLSIALFGGMLLVTDLRLLGWALKSRDVSDIWYLALPWKRLGRTGAGTGAGAVPTAAPPFSGKIDGCLSVNATVAGASLGASAAICWRWERRA